ncbi:MAG: DNA topoisomerase I [Rhodospirillaceae bacterium]|nr:MAG: DNA topoisomerase I [Rhodospirillaceae bacterium]
MKAVVVVESPAKAKTIGKYLGEGYFVVASYGHIRDLPARDGSVRPDENFAMDWEVDARAERHIQDIAKALRGAERLYLATDPDREGEAISWHVREELARRAMLGDIDVKRITFHEITRDAIQNALLQARGLNDEMVEAYLARRALDYLVGFTLSPVLWRKLPGSRSAGRVQSVALRLVCEREAEIERFVPREYWTVDADVLTAAGAPFTARLTHLSGEKLDKFSLSTESAARAAQARIESATLAVGTVERKKTKRHPSPPFTTSTLQQEAARKLHLGARRTMQIAQRLYEGVYVAGESVGLITYMRTDGVQMAAEAVAAIRDMIAHTFGPPYRPSAPRVYKAKAKNAQEAHEAIRPTDITRRPQTLEAFLDRNQLHLYELIWKRTMACQMESAELDQVAVDVISADRAVVLRATGSMVTFDGFLRLYREDKDEDEARTGVLPDVGDDDNRLLPPMTEGEDVRRRAVRPEQHFTQPPPRYSEASLVKKLEELGIGRPSTYASIITVLQDRNYVRLENRRFISEDRGRVVTAFLENYFSHYVQYNFTAEMEEQLDDVSGGRVDWKTVLRQFWTDFIRHVDGTKDLRVSEVLDRLDQELGAHFFPPDGTGRGDPRQCPTCAEGRLSLKLGRFGAFIGCSGYPECHYTRPLSILSDNGQEAEKSSEGTRELGIDPETGAPVSLRKGPYGLYVQRDPVSQPKEEPPVPEVTGRKGKGRSKKNSPPKPKRVSLPKGTDPGAITLGMAVQLLALPREIGSHPVTGQPVSAGLGRFGPYLRHGDVYKSLPAGEDLLTIGMNRAVDLLTHAGRTLGAHPADGKPVLLKNGRYGAYVAHNKRRATLPKNSDAQAFTLEEAVTLLAVKAAGN